MTRARMLWAMASVLAVAQNDTLLLFGQGLRTVYALRKLPGRLSEWLPFIVMQSGVQWRRMRRVTPRERRESAMGKGNAMSFGDVLWVLAVFAFWGGVFSLMFLFVRLISRGRDDEETACDLPSQTDAASHAPA